MRNVLSSAADLGIYPAIGLALFFLVFVAAVAWAFSLKKAHVEAMGRLPLENDPNEGDARDE
jgi:cbb3-type cytochrome oxidase subunit 3